MYDIYSDELDEMYELRKNDNLNLGKGITPTDPIKTLLGGKFIVQNENCPAEGEQKRCWRHSGPHKVQQLHK